MAQDAVQETKIESVSVAAPKRPLAVKLLALVPVLLALVSIPPGVSMLEDPTGTDVGARFVLPYLTRALPFIKDFLPIGVWLVTMYGALPIAVAAGVWGLKRWARYASIFLGTVVIAWIGIELPLFSQLGFTWFYPLIGGMGAAILALSLSPTVRRSFSQ